MGFLYGFSSRKKPDSRGLGKRDSHAVLHPVELTGLLSNLMRAAHAAVELGAGEAWETC
jgi:hypothetical protein